MMSKTALIAATMFAASASGAFAQTCDITITGPCDTLTLTLASGIVVGQSNAPNGCDDGNMIGYEAKLASSVYPGGKVLIASSDLGLSPDAWSWAFNLKTKDASLTGTPDGSTIYASEWNFTYKKAKDGEKFVPTYNGKPSAVSMVLAHPRVPCRCRTGRKPSAVSGALAHS